MEMALHLNRNFRFDLPAEGELLPDRFSLQRLSQVLDCNQAAPVVLVFSVKPSPPKIMRKNTSRVGTVTSRTIRSHWLRIF